MNTRAVELVTNEDGRVIGVRCQQDGGFFLGNTVYNAGKNIAADLLYHGMIVSAQGKRCITTAPPMPTTTSSTSSSASLPSSPKTTCWTASCCVPRASRC